MVAINPQMLKVKVMRTNTQLAISTANSVRQLADGTVVCEGHGPDGGTVMVMLGRERLDLQVSFGEAHWHMVLTREGDDDPISVDMSEPATLTLMPVDAHNGHHTRREKEVVLCPLCGGKRHWKDSGKPGTDSYIACSWRQWARDEGKLVDPDNPEYKDNDPERTKAHEAEFQRWMQSQPKDRMFGSVHAERILRQRRRAQLKANSN